MLNQSVIIKQWNDDVESFLSLRRYAYQIFTCVSVTVNNVAISARSVDDRYFLSSNFFSSSNICLPVNVVRAFFFFFFCELCNKSPSSLFEFDRQRSENKN